MAERTTFRHALRDLLEQTFEVRFEPGMFDGPVGDRDVGFVVWDGARAGRDRTVEENVYRARLYRRHVQEQGDPTIREQTLARLEDDAERLEEAMRESLVRLGHWYVNVESVGIDQDQQGVEVVVVAFDENRSGWQA